MRAPALAAALTAGLSACAGGPVATFAAADLATAQNLAVAASDRQGAACWGAMLPMAQAVQQGQQIGAATAAELYRVAVLAAQGPCAPIVLPIVVRLGPLLSIPGAVAAASVVAR